MREDESASTPDDLGSEERDVVWDEAGDVASEPFDHAAEAMFVDGVVPTAPRQDGVFRRRLFGAGSFQRYGVLTFLAALIVLFIILDPSHFLTQSNFITIIQSNSAYVLLALAATLMLRAGSLDFSLSASMILGASVVAVLMAEKHWSLVAAGLVAVGVTGFVGAFNGIMVVLVGLDGFIYTLGMSTVLTGVAYAVTNDNTITGLPSSLLSLGRVSIGDIPMAVLFGWILAVLLWLLFEFTPFGRILAFVGGNQVSSRLAGVRVSRVRMIVFIVAAMIAGFTGILLASSLGNVDPTTGGSYLLGPFSAAFLGAAAIQVGRFNIAGTIIGVYVVAVAETGLELLGASPWVSQVFNGAALIGAIAFARVATARTRDLLTT